MAKNTKRERKPVTQASRYIVEGNVVRQPEAEPLRKKQQPRTKTRRRKAVRRSARKWNRRYVLFLAAVSAIVLVSCVYYLRLNQTVSRQLVQIAEKETELNNLKSDNDTIYNQVMASLDLEEIKEKAMNELGMEYPGEDQVYNFNTSDKSYVRQYQDVPSAE